MKLLDNAVNLGSRAHAGKTWYAGKPYIAHLQAVQDNVVKFLRGTASEEALEELSAAAWLHDAVEDAGVTLEQVEEACGKDVRALVWAVTDEPGANRAERHEKTYPKTRNVPYAVALKLADRIANVEASANNRGGFFDMYRKEHYDFKRALYTKGEFESMWSHLDQLLSEDPTKQAIKLADKLVAEIRKFMTDSHIMSEEVDLYGTLHKRFSNIINTELNSK